MHTTEDRQAISDLLIRLGRWLDGRPGEPADFYDRDVEVISPRTHLRGIDAVTDFLARTSGERTQHFLSDVLIEFDGDRATVTANQLVHFFEPRQAPYRMSGLDVTYTLVRRPHGWRLARMEMTLEWIIGDLPAASATA